VKRRTFIVSALGLGAQLAGARLGVAQAAGTAASALNWRDRVMLGFGTTLTLRVAHADVCVADGALDAVVRIVRHIESLMSLFLPDSALSTLNRTGVLADPHPDLVSVLLQAQALSRLSDGDFDVTVQPLWNAFAGARLQGRLPQPEEVRRAKSMVDWRSLIVEPQAVRLLRPGMGVTLNGIAQGFASDLALASLRASGIRHALIDTGEYGALGQSPNTGNWRLGVQNPRADNIEFAVECDGRSMATSGDYQTYFSDDFRHHHIFDPHTGYSPPALASATVVAPTGALADGLTKVMFVAGPERAYEYARRWPHIDVLLIEKSGAVRHTPGIKVLPAHQASM
jgi:thiamine biosynthesis lipoprotein